MRISDWSSDVCSSDLRGETHPDILDIDPRDPLRLLDRLAHRDLGRGHVGDIAALDATALALAGAEHDQFAAIGLLRDHRRHFRRPDVEDRKSTRLNYSL